MLLTPKAELAATYQAEKVMQPEQHLNIPSPVSQIPLSNQTNLQHISSQQTRSISIRTQWDLIFRAAQLSTVEDNY
eukprot:1157679-Pelagomonas_calceolata.AAC.2